MTETGVSTSADLAAADRAHEAEVEHDLNSFAEMHSWDPNLDTGKLDAIADAVKAHDVETEAALERELLEENSVYPEVCAAVQNWDDPSVPANTLRAWLIGMAFVTLGSGMNMLFSLRQPTIAIGNLVAQISSYPVGVFMAKIFPNRQFNLFGLKFNLNPGPFNKKEHVIIVVMANVSFAGGAAYSTFALEAMRGFYNVNYGTGFSILLTLATQVTGIAMAGAFRRFLVDPPSVMYPSVLPNCALFNTLHDEKQASDPTKTNGWSISRFRFYFYVLTGAFLWYWFPGWLWQGLSVFAWVTWIKPNSVIVNQLFGGFSGISLFPPFTVFTLDWTMVASYVVSPLTVPWHSLANTLIGLVIFVWIITSAVHFSGTWYSDYLPMSDSNSYDNTGQSYNVSRILNDDFTLNVDKYKEYSPIFLSTTFALQYGLSFAATIALVVHTALYHGKDLWKRLSNPKAEPKDVHGKLYEVYTPVPTWWYLVLNVIMIVIGFVCVLKWDTQLPWWGYVLALAIAGFFLIPVGLIVAIYNMWIGLNVVCDVIISYARPGRPIGMLVFRSLSYNTLAQAISFSESLKMGFYMKVAPRTLFVSQLTAAVWSCIVQVGVFMWAFGNIKDICSEDQVDKYSCPNGRVFFQNSIVWGVIGPKRIFGAGSIYGFLQWFWLFGAALPVILYVVARKWPRSPTKYLHGPIIFGGIQQIPPAVPMNFLMWIMVGFIFSKLIRDRFRGWWLQYNYLLSAALDAGLALCTILIFLTLQLTQKTPPDWWGNRVVSSTLDQQGIAIKKTVADGETFGPPKGAW
ncbi:small oligopeptide transporter [Microthyrium microscopicum]|uniref:Small oligopeptide transporter n=1 Tax=Microthyrium microscopicum TaxID=703497 RepID=A0A6A6UAQ0_9PEZI|nr:small oligopeptide transporter [Microthyrium microscopicum]